MARTKNNQRSANRVAVDVGATGTKPASMGAVLVLAVSVLAAVWAVAMMTPPGRVGYYYFFIYAEYYMGVIALVSLSITIMVGLVATDRLVLSIRQRVLLQSTHRTTGVIAVAGLFVHVWSKIVESHIRVIDAFVPFLSAGNRFYVGLGTLSGLIMVLVMWTGIARSRFIGRGSPWMWRSIHAISYLMWPIALVHGLSAGRSAKPWVTVSYVLCILLVLVGLAVRLSVSLNRKKDFSSTSTGGVKPVGRLLPTVTSPVMKRASRRDESHTDLLTPVAVTDTWLPAAPLVTAEPARPLSRRPPELALDEDEEVRPRGRRRAGDDFEIEYAAPAPAPRRRRYADDYEELAAPRGGHYADDDEYDEPPGRRAVPDLGRHSRGEFDDPHRASFDMPPPDDTPTLIDMASRRARKAQQQDAVRGPASRGARRGTGRGRSDEAAGDRQWSRLREEAN
jgi:DMSO/TMAO reductase YedYZ heme-binding membrane subunit